MSKIRFSKKDDPARRWRSFKRHVLLMLQPSIFAVVITLIWDLILWRNNWHLPKEDEVIFTVPVITTLGVTFGINATISLGATWEKYRKVCVCVLTKDLRGFLILRDERIPIILHLFVAVLSIFVLGLTMFFEYKVEISGVVCVSIMSFVVSLYWFVLPQLEDPVKGAWFVERIPEDWLIIDVDEHFKLGAEEDKNQ